VVQVVPSSRKNAETVLARRQAKDQCQPCRQRLSPPTHQPKNKNNGRCVRCTPRRRCDKRLWAVTQQESQPQPPIPSPTENRFKQDLEHSIYHPAFQSPTVSRYFLNSPPMAIHIILKQLNFRVSDQQCPRRGRQLR